MSRPAMIAVMLLIVSTAAVAQPAVAQPAPGQPGPQTVMQRQRALLDSLAPRMLELREQMRLEESLRLAEAEREWERTELDTLRLGPINVIGVPDEVARWRDLFEDVWSAQRHLFTGLDEALAGETIVLTDGLPSGMRTLFASRGHYQLQLGSLLRRRHRRAVESTMTARIIALMPQPVRQWITNEMPPYDVPDEEVYRRLTLLGSFRAEACLGGDMDSCAAVLGLDGSDPYDLYTSAELTRLADRRATTAGGRAHVHFLGYAMAAAEPGMFARLRHERTGTIGERIERAAGIPLTVLLEGWHAGALATRPDPDRHGGRTRFATVLWVAVLAMLAVRSTRWRIG